MMSNDENLISDFAAYFTSLGTTTFKERDSMAAFVFYNQPFVKIALLKTLRENVEELLRIISSVKRFFIEVAR